MSDDVILWLVLAWLVGPWVLGVIIVVLGGLLLPLEDKPEEKP